MKHLYFYFKGSIFIFSKWTASWQMSPFLQLFPLSFWMWLFWGFVFLFLLLGKSLEKLIRIFQFKNIAIILTMNDLNACHFDEVNGIMRSLDSEPTHTKMSFKGRNVRIFTFTELNSGSLSQSWGSHFHMLYADS
jgi:hypothetical protein